MPCSTGASQREYNFARSTEYAMEIVTRNIIVKIVISNILCIHSVDEEYVDI